VIDDELGGLVSMVRDCEGQHMNCDGGAAIYCGRGSLMFD